MTITQLNPQEQVKGYVPGLVGIFLNVKLIVGTQGATQTITADEVTVGASITGLAYKLATLSQSINLGTTGVGGVDTGTVGANTFISIYACYNPTTRVQGAFVCLASSSNGPTYSGSSAPSGYTATGLIGIYPTGTSAGTFAVGGILSRNVYFPPIQVLSTTTMQAAYTSLSISAAVPPGAKAWSGDLTANNNGGNTTQLMVAADASGSGRQTTAALSTAVLLSSSGGGSPTANVPIFTSQVTYYKSATSGGTATITINITGYLI